ncbi:methyltransferase domain-containing protein [Ferruginibacter lapsinanis]|uniref:methyltransferase domain-containing protein n=1 Tax=Ferruginibacter lapsinanis TaxID=563172 RepID=UPI001E3E3E4A|nr:methyltransferase domain-containing protein [Ferruginibacter lapsinanis]UEG50212.1 methyltransferase domain-containing protein [Ferruginibacter lapsinanis]
MSRFNSYINTASHLIKNYKGETPFAIFLRTYFGANKKYGSRDRKQIASLCYNYFRTGHVAADEPIENRILLGNFLCETAPSDLMESLASEWNKIIDQPIDKKISAINNAINIQDIFPFKEELSNGIDPELFCRSYLIQPDLFLRIRPKTRIGFLKKLEKANLDHTILDEDCLVLPNTSKVEEHFILDKEIIVQDYNSQKVFDHLRTDNIINQTMHTAVWDCCAASGGKSILLMDLFNHKIDLTVSDIRPSIILNLHQRFKKAGIKSYNYFISDIEKAGFQHPIAETDIIVCDAPCTGSGTWGRTPEQLHYFNKETIESFSDRQKKIASNVIPYLKKDGLFIYITCSVFKKENEEVANSLMKDFDLELLQMEILKGYDKKADSMFVTIFRKK